MAARTLTIAACRVFSAAAVAVTYLLVARTFDPAGFGRFAVLLSASASLVVLADLGSSTQVMRDLAVRGSSGALRDAVAIRLWCFGALVVVLIVAFPLSSTHIFVGLILAAIQILALSVQLLMVGLLLGRQRVLLAMSVTIVDKLITLALIGLTLSVVDAPEPLLLAGEVVAGTVATVVGHALALAAPSGAWGKVRSLPDVIRESRSVNFGFAMGAFGSQLQNFDVTVAGIIGGTQVAGLLAAPSRITTPIGLLASSASASILSSPGERSTRTMLQESGGIAILTAALTSPLWAFPGTTVSIMLGGAYAESAPIFRLVGVAVLLSSVSQQLVAVLQRRGFERRTGRIILVSGIVGIASLWLTIPMLGAAGAGWSIVLSQLLIFSSLILSLQIVRSGRGGLGGRNRD